MLTVGLYELKTKETPQRGELKFYKRLGVTNLPELVPSITLVLEGESEPTKFIYDTIFSKEAGHHAYARSEDSIALTPFAPPHFDSSPSSSERDGVRSTGSDTAEAGSDRTETDTREAGEVTDVQSGGDNVQQ